MFSPTQEQRIKNNVTFPKIKKYIFYFSVQDSSYKVHVNKLIIFNLNITAS